MARKRQPLAFDYDELQERMRQVKGSQGRCAQAMGFSPEQLSAKVRGTIGFTLRDIMRLIVILRIPMEDVGRVFFTLQNGAEDELFETED